MHRQAGKILNGLKEGKKKVFELLKKSWYEKMFHRILHVYFLFFALGPGSPAFC
jgi:hypothetical protein